MKIKNLKLMLVSAFLIMGSNAFAQKIQKATYNGVRYEYDADQAKVGDAEAGSATNPFKATVVGVVSDVTSLEIGPIFNKTDENDKNLVFIVTGFKANWAKATGEKDVTAKLTSLTIDAKNMAYMTNAFVGLTKLAKLKVSNDTWTNEGYVTGHMGAAGSTVLTTIEELDLSGLTKVEKLAGDFKVSGDNWKKMTKLSLPANLTAIPDYCFQDSKVTDLTFTAAKLASIGNFAFMGAAITAIDLSETKVTVIPQQAFNKAADLATVTLPAALTTIGESAFEESGITSIVVPATVTSIGKYAFLKCEKMTTADLSAAAELTVIDERVFDGDKLLTAITIPAKVTTIGEKAFNGCAALATLTINTTKLASIGNAAFAGSGITAFTLPATEATAFTMGDGVFEGCEALVTFTAAKDSKLTGLGTNGFKGCKSLETVDIENASTTTIWADYFPGCESLKEIKLPKTVKEINAGAFAGTVLESLDLSATGVTTLNDIFQGTKDDPYASLTSFKFPAKGFTTISGGTKTTGVFRYCTGLEEIDIPATIASNIPAYTFYSCDKLTTVNYEPTSKDNAKKFDEKAFLGCKPFVKINTNSFYFAKNGYVEPINATFGLADDLSVTTVKDNGKSGKYFGKICSRLDIKISKEDLGDAKLYSVYEDNGIAYFQALKVRSGYYNIPAEWHAIVKTDAEATINFELGTGTSSISEDNITTFNNTADQIVADYMEANPGIKYFYALTNNKKNGGFGFTFYTGTTMPKGAFFIPSKVGPKASGRLESVWLDEDGNVESEATAINKIQSETEDGAIYNLQGVRVNNAKKGIYIKNGKKYIMK